MITFYPPNSLEEIAALFKKGKVVAFCGAGLSAESGIPVFRGKGGLWEKYDPNLYATEEGVKELFFNSPQKIAGFIIDFYSLLINNQPNYAHFALAELEKKGIVIGTITQNIDDFHYQAGAEKVAEVHGNAYVFRCRECGLKIKKNKEEIKEFIYRLKRKKKGREIIKEILKVIGRCPLCRRRRESGVVLFGQALPEEEIEKSYKYVNEAETIICIGTSGLVYPAASFPQVGKARGAKIVTVNPEETNLDSISDYVVRETAVNFFKKIMPLLCENEGED